MTPKQHGTGSTGARQGSCYLGWGDGGTPRVPLMGCPLLGGSPSPFGGGSGAAASPLAQQRDRVAALLLLVTLAAALGAQEGWRAGTAPPWGKGPPQGTETPLGERMPPGKRTPPPPPRGEGTPGGDTPHCTAPPTSIWGAGPPQMSSVPANAEAGDLGDSWPLTSSSSSFLRPQSSRVRQSRLQADTML